MKDTNDQVILFKINGNKYFINVPKNVIHIVDKQLYGLMKISNFLYFNKEIRKSRYNAIEAQLVFFELSQNYLHKSTSMKEIKLEHIDLYSISLMSMQEAIVYIESCSN